MSVLSTITATPAVVHCLTITSLMRTSITAKRSLHHIAASSTLSSSALSNPSSSFKASSSLLQTSSSLSPFSSAHFASSFRQFSSRFDRDGVPTLRIPPVHIGFAIVPQQQAYVIERLGKFHRVLDPGFHLLLPIFDSIAYVHSLKEEAVNIPNQQAITMDNVTITIDGVLYLRVVDPKLASYGVSNMYYAMTQLAQTTMRSELGKMTLDKTFAERESLNAAIVHQMNRAAEPWGIKCLRYEIRDILPPHSVKNAMDMQAEAERRKRATILDSEGQQQAEINIADGNRQATALQALGDADAIIARAKATAQGIELVSNALKRNGGQEAAALRLAEQYVKAFGELAKESNTMLLPSNPADPASMIASALGIYQQVLRRNGNESGKVDTSAPSATPPSAEDRAANEALLTKLLHSTKSDSTN